MDLENAGSQARFLIRDRDGSPGISPSAVSGQAECDLVVPGSIRQIVETWRAAGAPSQDGIEWPRERWVAAFPAHAATFTALPDHLDRTAVRHACVHAAVSSTDAERAFLAVMAWGYGRVGYGPFRVQRVLAAAPAAGAQLQAAASSAAHGRPVEAYGCQGDHGTARLPHLGPAFGTKFLYFCSPTGLRPPSSSTAWWRAGSARMPAWPSTNCGGPPPPTRATSRPCSAGPTSCASPLMSSSSVSSPRRLGSAKANGPPELTQRSGVESFLTCGVRPPVVAILAR